jgi:sporulation protein YlmC with PRC-barrel domain
VNEFRVGADLYGADGERLGALDAVIVDPTTRSVTSLVLLHVRLGPRLLVPTERVTSADPDRVDTDLTERDLDDLQRFDEPNFNAPSDEWAAGESMLDPGSYFLEPYATPFDGWAMAEHERVPKGEISIRRGDEVYSSDGTRVGHIDEFLVDPADGQITHVVLRQGHIFRHDEDVVIPVSSVTEFDEARVVLGIDVKQVDALPKIPVERHSHVER